MRNGRASAHHEVVTVQVVVIALAAVTVLILDRRGASLGRSLREAGLD
jgi:hypothetical protein